jgi:hypothetical protein
MARTTLETQLTHLTAEFVGRLVQVIRNASFADVAALTPAKGNPPPVRRGPREEAPRTRRARRAGAKAERQTKSHRAELGERVVKTLTEAHKPLGVRALSSELGVAPDLLAVPLRELRVAGRIQKHGEKRNTTYSPN